MSKQFSRPAMLTAQKKFCKMMGIDEEQLESYVDRITPEGYAWDLFAPDKDMRFLIVSPKDDPKHPFVKRIAK